MIIAAASFAKSKKSDEKRFQLGIGLMASTGNLLGLIESARMYNAISKGDKYDYPGLSKQEKDSLNSLNGAMQRAILVANILGSMEYGIQLRVLWHMLMVNCDVVLLPFDGSYNGRLDFMITPSVGIRAPFWLMPYLLVGMTMTFSFYPDEFTDKENWKGEWAATDNFVFRPGMNFRAGLDFKFKSFSIGAYYQYTIKDFQEFSLWYNDIVDNGMTAADAAGKIFGAQSRFGAAMCFYLF